MTEQDRQDALLHPRAGDVIQIGRRRYQVESYRPSGWVGYRQSGLPKVWEQRIDDWRKWTSTATLVKRGPNA